MYIINTFSVFKKSFLLEVNATVQRKLVQVTKNTISKLPKFQGVQH